MKKVFLKSALSTALMVSSQGMVAPVFAEETSSEQTQDEAVKEAVKLTKDDTTGYLVWATTGISPRANLLTPTYYIFPSAMSEEDAQKVVDELDMAEACHEWGSTITVILPKDGKAYGEEDLKDFETMIAHAPITNVKIIGLDDGATFINNKIADHANYVAGMLLVNGEMDEGIEVDQATPVYLVNPSDTVKSFYEQANAQEGVRTDLQKTVVGQEEDLDSAFKSAFEQIFIQNYRASNDVTEFYNLPMLADRENTLEFEFELSESPVLDQLGVTYNEKIHQTLPGMDGKDYAWFEYLPDATLEAEEKSVPLVVTLHGNQNDPRLQGDTSGWIETAAKENFIVVSPEYQTAEQNAFFTQEPNRNIYGTVDGMGQDGIMTLIENLQEEYPQIDPSRIYVSGLSQGGAMTSLLGLKHSDVFAATAPVSGVNAYHEEIEEIQKDYQGNKIPFMYLCGDHDFFQMIPVDGSSEHGTSELFGDSVWASDDNVHIYSILTGYQTANGLETAEMDMEANPYFGIQADAEEDIELGGKTAHVYSLNDGDTTMMKLVAIEDQAHWNQKAEAEYIWNFFKGFSRDTETGEVIVEAVGEEEPAGGMSKTMKGVMLVIGYLIIAFLCFGKPKKDKKAE